MRVFAPRFRVITAHQASMARWSHTPRAEPYARLYHNLDPGWSIEHEGRRHVLDRRRLLLLPPETIYHGHGPGPMRHRFVHVLIEGLDRDLCRRPWELPVGASERRLLASLAGPHPEAELAAVALVAGALARLPAEAWQEPLRASAPVAAALAQLDRIVHRAVPNAELGRLAGMDPCALVRAFRRELGVPPQLWHRRHRIARACTALAQSEADIEAIAQAHGFCDRHHFARVFTRLRGCGPAAWRRTARQGREG